MADAIQIVKIGFRVEDSNADPVSGAVLYFFDAGTTTPRTVYSDYNLSVSLGTSVTCNSVGLPTSNGTTVCEIYTGASRYKCQIKDSSAVLIPGMSWDNIIGALDTSGFATTTAAVAPSFLAKSADYTVLAADNGALIEVDTTSGNVAIRLPNAVTVGATFVIGIRKKVAANNAVISSVSSQTIRYDASTAATSYTMVAPGELLRMQSDGANWFVADKSLIVVPSDALDATPIAGKFEYDGTAFHSSFAASQRGISPSLQFASIVTGAKTALTNSITTAQNIFASANDVLTVAASTSYRFRARIGLNTGATSHTTAFGIALTTATLTSINYTSWATSSAATTLAAPQMLRAVSNAAQVITAASTAVQTEILIEGIMRVNAAGSITPQITFSAGPTGTCEVDVDSFFELWPIGSNTVVSEGPWA